MARILHFTSGPSDWQALLADPTKHWREGYSARTLAHCWEAAPGFPPEVEAALAAAIMVEGKVNESFGPTVEKWRLDPPGKKTRLSFLGNLPLFAVWVAGDQRFLKS